MRVSIEPFEKKDAERIVSWIKDREALRMWSADRYGDFPICAQDILQNYEKAAKQDRLILFCAYDGAELIGHLTMRFPLESPHTVRFGYVIVDDQKRGMGYGKAMIQSAVSYAAKTFDVEKITLGVFADNPSAYHCYRAAGFTELEQEVYYQIDGQNRRSIEMAYLL